jgi:D-threo-aldose 1-dehydrogenase
LTQRLGLGCAPLAGLYSPVSEEDARATVDRAWELGVRVFDTAPKYGSGLSERRVGAALRDRPRDAFSVSTKVGRLLRAGEAVFDFSYDGVLRSLDESLERLGLDRVDVVLVHDPDDHYDEAVAGAYRALERLREEGVVAAIGVGMNQWQIPARFVRETDIDCVLLAGRYTLLDRSAERELLPLCAERNVDVIAAGVFNGGILAGGTYYDYAPAPPELLERTQRLAATCARHGVPLEAAAVQFPLRHPAVTTALIGCRSAAEVEEDVRLAGLELPPELWAEL